MLCPTTVGKWLQSMLRLCPWRWCLVRCHFKGRPTESRSQSRYRLASSQGSRVEIPQWLGKGQLQEISRIRELKSCWQDILEWYRLNSSAWAHNQRSMLAWISVGLKAPESAPHSYFSSRLSGIIQHTSGLWLLHFSTSNMRETLWIGHYPKTVDFRR